MNRDWEEIVVRKGVSGVYFVILVLYLLNKGLLDYKRKDGV